MGKQFRIQNITDALKVFEECAIIRGAAIMDGDSKTANKYYSILNKALVYLYEHDSLALLYPFLSHEDFNVRLVAAYALLPLNEKESKEVLLEIANGDYRIYGIQGLSAERTLKLWESGEIYFPYKKEKTIKKKEETSTHKNNNSEETMESEEFSPEILRLSQIFECPPTDNYELRNEESGFYVKINPERQELIVNINTFINPYTQDVESVYQKRLERFKVFEHLATVSVEKPSKFGFMKIWMTIPEKEIIDDVLTQIKDAIDWNLNEWKPNECKVCCKAEYKGAECYFEGSWWYVWRAVIKNRKGYERYDFSDELKFDDEMWNLESGEYDDFENSDSFSLISPSEFESIWNKTTRIHKPVPY